MGPVEHRERESRPSHERFAVGKPELDSARPAVITLDRAALASSGHAPQVGDLIVVDIGGTNRAVIVFQLDVDEAVVVDVT